MLMGRKWADLVNLSTITHMASCFCLDRGSPDTKSIVIISHFHCGTSKGWSGPTGRRCKALTCWQGRHLEMNSATSFLAPGREYCPRRSWYILVLPGCTA